MNVLEKTKDQSQIDFHNLIIKALKKTAREVYNQNVSELRKLEQENERLREQCQKYLKQRNLFKTLYAEEMRKKRRWCNVRKKNGAYGWT